MWKKSSNFAPAYEKKRQHIPLRSGPKYDQIALRQRACAGGRIAHLSHPHAAHGNEETKQTEIVLRIESREDGIEQRQSM